MLIAVAAAVLDAIDAYETAGRRTAVVALSGAAYRLLFAQPIFAPLLERASENS